MTTTETVAILCAFNEWRRGDYEPSEQPEPPDPCKISEAIDAAIEMIERMEKHLRLILEEPENTMSNGKAMREMLRQARLALGESK